MTAPTTKVKICGISEPEHALIAADAGADYIGLNFFPGSHRCIAIEQATTIAREVRATAGKSVKLVGLFVNESAERMNQIVRVVGLDIVQLSGDEDPELVAHLDVPVIGTVRVNDKNHPAARARFEAWVQARPSPHAVIVDSHVPGAYGGTGTVGDWDQARIFSKRYRTFLAGGLSPENVAQAIETVRPYAVDVSSGVETGRHKDPEKIRAFIAATRAATNVVRKTA